MDWAFETTAVEAITPKVHVRNPRARHVCAREGFAQYDADEADDVMRAPRARWAERRGR